MIFTLQQIHCKHIPVPISKNFVGENKGIPDSECRFHDEKVLWAANNDKK